MREPDVVFEDNHLLVLNKPAVLATMGAAEGEPSLFGQCKAWLKHKYNKPGNVYLGVVSRLDAFVTGTIVFAKTSKAASRLTKQFQLGTPTKQYLAIVSGARPRPQATLEDWLVKNDSRRRMVVAVPDNPAAKRATLRYELVAQTDSVDSDRTLYLLRVDLLTGRKHQIRVQLAAAGMPIVGDRKYESEVAFPKGIALHSKELSLDHPTGRNRLTFTTQPPVYWKMGRFGI